MVHVLREMNLGVSGMDIASRVDETQNLIVLKLIQCLKESGAWLA